MMDVEDVWNIQEKLEEKAEQIKNEQLAYVEGIKKGLDMMTCGIRDFLRKEEESNERTEN